MKSETLASLVRKRNLEHAKVLVIDHNAAHLSLINHCLTICLPEVEVIATNSEHQALTYLSMARLDDRKLPKMIFFDLLMPTLEEGWRMLRGIKQLPAPANQIPVIVFSRSDHTEVICEAYDRGVSSYLIKPSSDDDWLAYFQRLKSYWWETVSLPTIDYRF